MEDLNKNFWANITIKYPKESTKFAEWIEFSTGFFWDEVFQYDVRNECRYPDFDAIPPAFQLGLFLQYTMQHENKQDWFRTKNHGTVTEQISRWFEIEHRRNSEPAKKHSAYPAFL